MDGKVWLISSGCYSDYSVSCAFTTRELAIAYCARTNKLTVEEQTQVADCDEMPWPDSRRVEESLPPHVRRIAQDDYSYRVEERDLFDSLPLADA